MVRPLLDIFIFMSQHALLFFAGLLVVGLVSGRFVDWDGTLRRFFRRGSSWFVYGMFVLVLGIFLGIGSWYLGLNGYAGEVEPMISSVSWLVNHGHPLYHAIDSPARYSVLYGPSVYLTNGLFLQLLGANLAATKLASLLATFLSLVCLYGAVARQRMDKLGILAVLLAMLFFWNQGFSIYLVRPDAFLVFAVSFALLAIRRATPWLMILAVGVALGYAVNLKIHAVLYFLPVLVLMTRRAGWRSLAGTLVLALAVAAAPFAFHPQVSATNYLQWLRAALGHGFTTETLVSTTRFGLILMLPLVAALIFAGGARLWLRRNALLVLVLVASLGLTLLMSTKPGAGLVHMLPMVPLYVYLAAGLVRDLDHTHWQAVAEGRRRLFLGRLTTGALFVTLLMAGSIHAYRSTMLVNYCNRHTADWASDLVAVMADNPEVTISMAWGGENDYFRTTWLRPLLVFQDNPVLVDPIAVMDCRKAGMDMGEETFQAIKSGAIGLWLVPRDQKPFQKTNWYAPHDEICPERFIDHFLEHYTRGGHSRFFDFYFHNDLRGREANRPLPNNPSLAQDPGSPGIRAGI